jgi:hypothetical protein
MAANDGKDLAARSLHILPSLLNTLWSHRSHAFFYSRNGRVIFWIQCG